MDNIIKETNYSAKSLGVSPTNDKMQEKVLLPEDRHQPKPRMPGYCYEDAHCSNQPGQRHNSCSNSGDFLVSTLLKKTQYKIQRDNNEFQDINNLQQEIFITTFLKSNKSSTYLQSLNLTIIICFNQIHLLHKLQSETM